MISESTFRGGARAVSPTGDQLVHPQVARVWRVNASGAGAIVLPVATTVRLGHCMLIANVAGGALTVKNQSGTTVVSIPAGQSSLLHCYDNTTTDGGWRTRTRAHAIA